MTTNTEHDSNRWEDLQAARLLFGLSPEEQVEYDYLSREKPNEAHNAYETVVASLDLLWSNMKSEPLPQHLREAIRNQAAHEFAFQRTVNPEIPSKTPRATIFWSTYVPWLVSAACITLVVFSMSNNGTVQKPSSDLAQLRAELMTASDEIVQLNWTAGPTPIQNASGDIVWSSSKQQGYMRFRGLTANTPTQEQYQLWIFDKNQSDKTPVDGGVFNIATTDEVIIPIDAKLHVQQPFMFAITIEKPGGVVVSSRERLPLLAKVE